MVYEIPVNASESAYITQSVNLSGTAFTFRFLWNERDNRWYMDVKTNAGEKTSIRIIPNDRLLGENSPVTAAGDFMLLSTEINADPEKMEYADFGNKWKLCWVTEE